MILDNSDPGYRYWKAENVQSSNARISSGNKVASYDIFSQTVMPLEQEESRASYSWLLEGSEHDVRKVHGLTGLSSKLLHTFAQITHLAAQLKEVGLSVFKVLWLSIKGTVSNVKKEPQLDRHPSWGQEVGESLEQFSAVVGAVRRPCDHRTALCILQVG